MPTRLQESCIACNRLRFQGSCIVSSSTFYSTKIVSYILIDAKTICSERVSEVQNQVFNKIEFLRHNIESLWKNVLPLVTKMGSKMTSLYTKLKD